MRIRDGTPEFDLNAVQQEYTRLLNRAPETGAADSWLAALQAAGSTEPLSAATTAGSWSTMAITSCASTSVSLEDTAT